MVSRVVEIPAAQAAPMEVVVSGLPSATDPNSVYADQAQGVVIRSVAFRTKTPDKATQAQSEVAKLEQSIKDLRRTSAIAHNEIALRRIRQDFLKRLGSDFVAPAAQQEMTHGVLQADELQKLTKLHFEEYEKASQEIMKLDLEIEETAAQLQVLEDRRKTLAAGPPVAYEAVVYLQKTADDPASLKLNYLVNDCGWDPSYNFRGDTAKGEVAMEFNAIVHQVSGEDWSDVKLALSTASPSVGAYNPQLSPLFVRVQPGAEKEESRTVAQTKYSQALASRQEALVRQFRGNSIFSRYQKFVIAILAFLQFSIILDFMIISPLGAMVMPALHISPQQFGLAVSSYAFSAGASGLLAAGFADRFDRKRLLLFFYAGFILGTLLCALATTYPAAAGGADRDRRVRRRDRLGRAGHRHRSVSAGDARPGDGLHPDRLRRQPGAGAARRALFRQPLGLARAVPRDHRRRRSGGPGDPASG